MPLLLVRGEFCIARKRLYGIKRQVKGREPAVG